MPHDDSTHPNTAAESAQMKLIREWHQFVESECTKRYLCTKFCPDYSVALLAFIIDSQHSMMFGHSIVLHAQEVNLKPPCKEEVWAASSPRDWQIAMQRHDGEEIGFLEILKTFMNEPATAKDKVSLDPFGSFIALHGLISVKWHLQQSALNVGMNRTRCTTDEIRGANQQSERIYITRKSSTRARSLEIQRRTITLRLAGQYARTLYWLDIHS